MLPATGGRAVSASRAGPTAVGATTACVRWDLSPVASCASPGGNETIGKIRVEKCGRSRILLAVIRKPARRSKHRIS